MSTRRTQYFAGTAIVLSLAYGGQAGATITFSTGNAQYDNVNFPDSLNVSSVVGAIGSTGQNVTFENMIGPDGTTQVNMHSAHGTATLQNTADAPPVQVLSGFSAVTLMADTGYGWSAGDFKLDQLNSLTSPTGKVTLTGYDQFGNITSQILPISQSGQQEYNFTTADGELVTEIIISVATTDLLSDLKQVSLNGELIPEPASIATLGGMLGLFGLLRRRRR